METTTKPTTSTWKQRRNTPSQARRIGLTGIVPSNRPTLANYNLLDYICDPTKPLSEWYKLLKDHAGMEAEERYDEIREAGIQGTVQPSYGRHEGTGGMDHEVGEGDELKKPEE